MSQNSSEQTHATLVHVYGTDRSGSTMLDLILGNAPDAFSCGEVAAWFRPFRRHHFQIECACGQNPCPVWKKIKDVHESVFHTSVARELKMNYVIDSSKDICWLIDAQKWAAVGGLRTVILLIWKDPVSLAYSYWKRGREISSWRRSFIKCYGRVMQLGLPFISIKYDDLMEDPPHSVEKLCNALEISYFEGKERFWEGKYHYLFGSSGVRAQVASGQSYFEKRKDFPKEFQQQMNKIEKQLTEHDQTKQIIERLTQADIFHNRGGTFSTNTPEMPRFLPLWYYRKKFIRTLRRYIPETYNNQVISDVETIPVKHSL